MESGTEGKKKRCTCLRDNCNLKRVVKERPYKNMGRFPKSELEPEAVRGCLTWPNKGVQGHFTVYIQEI